MRGSGLLPGIVLLLFAAVTGYWVWQTWKPEAEPILVGPPRSDYFLVDFELVALDKQGQEAFRASGPRLARHPTLESITVEQPRFWFPDDSGGQWTARANDAWVDGNGDELRLNGNVAFDGPPQAKQGAVSLRTEQLSVFPETRTVASDAQVTVTTPRSILRGRGLRADIGTRRFQLLSEVEARYAPTPKSTPADAASGGKPADAGAVRAGS